MKGKVYIDTSGMRRAGWIRFSAKLFKEYFLKIPEFKICDATYDSDSDIVSFLIEGDGLPIVVEGACAPTITYKDLGFELKKNE
jgi:hypothetical protein